jgi:RNA polymerase sigma-70 factor (ECF subfamily)
MVSKDSIQESVLADEEIVRRIKDGDTYLFEIIMRRYNQRLFRVIRAIVKNNSETEDVMQEAYVRAYQHLDQFQGRAKFATWLTKIAVYDAYARVRDGKRISDPDDFQERLMTNERSPEEQTLDSELRSLLEVAVDSLPHDYRAVLMMRDIEGLSTTETADCLNITEENVKVRLFRARSLMRRQLLEKVGAATPQAFGFLGNRCDQMVACVLERIKLLTL